MPFAHAASTYAKARELRRLNSIVRKRTRVLQAGPDITHPQSLVTQAVSSLGIGRPQLKTFLLSAADIKAIPAVIHGMGPLARAINKLGGDFRWQHLPVPFEVYADGIDLVILDPAHLDADLDDYQENPVEQFGGLSRMVNRNDACVSHVLISGRTVVEAGVPTPLLGTERTGSFLRVGQLVAPQVAEKTPLVSAT